MIEYRILKLNTKALPSLWEENWNLNCIHDWMMFFSREVRKSRTSKPVIEDARFQEFYWPYPNKKSKVQAIKEWSKLLEHEKDSAIQIVPIYKKWCEHKYTENGKLNKDKILHPDTYLRNKRWWDELDIDWKSKDEILNEQNALKKRREQEEKQNRENEKLENERIENDLIIRRLQERNPKEYEKLYALWLEKLPLEKRNTWITPSLCKIAIRWIVGDNRAFYENLIKLQ